MAFAVDNTRITEVQEMKSHRWKIKNSGTVEGTRGLPVLLDGNFEKNS